MHTASEFNVNAKLCIHCFLAFCTMSLGLVSLRATCFGASHCFGIVGAIVHSFSLCSVRTFSANVLGGIVLEMGVLSRDAFFFATVCV